MSNPTQNWDSYRAPKEEILQNRRAFYGLKRQNNESTDKWLKRVQKCINCCEFPIFVEFFLIDRFVGGLDSTEMEIIRGTETWSLKQLLDYFFNRNINAGSIERNDKPNRKTSVDSESVSIVK